MNTRTMLVALLFYTVPASAQHGLFSRQGDVGPVLHPGASSYDASADTYLLSGSGSNIWFTRDEFHYLYTRLRGDFILQARGQLIGKGVEAHRKFGWMVRTSLDTGSSMITAAEIGRASCRERV